ncbi:uncharacterized protein LOC128964111 [Oppia nitens]|uniref:uncharacterized protein LOC128964111 n=1 Tax=Oppia nitens TaxID=1686743 RepID=UPI0023DBA112|nr:uncharacterized protein LOC128964111 [Oppia nitens]
MSSNETEESSSSKSDDIDKCPQISENLSEIASKSESQISGEHLSVDQSDQMIGSTSSPTTRQIPPESEPPVSAPPRRKFVTPASMRKTCTDCNDNTTDPQNHLQCNQTPIDDPLPTSINDRFNSSSAHVLAKCEESSPITNDQTANDLVTRVDHQYKQNLCAVDDHNPSITCDVNDKDIFDKRSANVKTNQNDLNRFQRQLMDAMRRWKNRWFTSDTAKASRRRRFNQMIYYLKIFLTHLFSTTGLCLLVIAYSCVGALIFTYLESKHEEILRLRLKNEIDRHRYNFTVELWDHTDKLNVLYPEEWINRTNDKLREFEETIVKAVREEGYGGVSNQWTFSGALLYSVTVITTIGYGNVTCKTDLGRIVTMIYALLGIPVMFLCLANLGNLMAKTFRFSYKRLCCICFCCNNNNNNNSNNNHSNNKLSNNQYNNNYSNNNNKMSNKTDIIEMKKSSCIDSERDVRVVFDENDEQKVRSIITVTASTPPTSTSVTSSQASSPLKSFTNTLNPMNSELNCNELVVVQGNTQQIDNSDDRVPIWLVIVLVIGYIMTGAFMFSIWEESWGLLEGAYFCFTTLSTIGFGDLVPGSAKYSDNKEEQTKFIICCAYLIVGLSMLAMSFNLVQEEIVIKSKEIARRMGIIPQQKTTDYDKTVSV